MGRMRQRSERGQPLGLTLALCALFLLVSASGGQAGPGAPSLIPAWEGPHNVILFIGDGMGPEQVKAAGMYGHGDEGTLFFESWANFPYQGEVTTYSASSEVTDSAAAATAMATGVKVNNGVLSVALPGDGSELATVLESARLAGKEAGLVTTCYMTHATPAGFGAHEPSRNNLDQIAADYLVQTQPEVLLGGGANGLTPATAQAAGYTVVADRAGMQALDPNSVTTVSGQFGVTHLPYEFDGLGDLPHLSEMTESALALLEDDPDGFFLMVEGGRIDHAGHINDIQRNILETIEFANAVEVAMAWAQGRDDTLLLVTADHECGGLTVLTNNGEGNWPTVSWSTTYHTGVNVPLYAWGPNAELVQGVLDNTDLYHLMVNSPLEGLLATSSSPTALNLPTTLTATVSAGGNATYSWGLSDDTWATGEVVQHIYPSVGAYTAVVTASNPLNSLTASTTVVITSSPQAVFTIQPWLGTAPLEATLTNGSGGIYQHSLWTFGDGLTSTLHSPSHTYRALGAYTVTLTVSGTHGTDRLIRPNAVKVVPGVFLPLILNAG